MPLVPLELDATATATATDGASYVRRPGDGLRDGDVIAHFRVDRRIGEGGMGEVWLATDLSLDRPVAIKVLLPDVAGDPSRRERLTREARAQARIRHPNVCHIYYIGEDMGRVFFVMEYIEGESLAQRLARQSIPPGEAIELMRMAALGLREAHRNGFTHRDVKPSNLMIDAHGQLRVVDFGLVTRGEGSDATDGEVTVTLGVGTPLYMAPEQATSGEIDFRADIYALGATFHHLLAGRPPFAGTTAAELRSLHAEAARPALPMGDRQGRRAASLLDRVLARMMAKRPEDRFASYDELIRELERISLLRTRPAGLFVRTAALAVDLLVVVLAATPLQFLVPESHQELVFLIVGAPYVILADARWGATLGYALLEITVVATTTDRPPPLRRSALRWLVQWGPIAAGVIIENIGQLMTYSMVRSSGVLLGLAGIAYVVIESIRANWRGADRCMLWDWVARTMVRYRRSQS